MPISFMSKGFESSRKFFAPSKRQSEIASPSYTLDADTATAPVLEKAAYLRQVAQVLDLPGTSMAHENRSILDHLGTEEHIEPSETDIPHAAPDEIRNLLRNRGPQATSEARESARPAVALKRITAYKIDPRQRKILADLAKMHDADAWLWPFSHLKSFAARKVRSGDPNAPIELQHARRLAPGESLQAGESHFAVHPTTYGIVDIRAAEAAPRLDTAQAMQKHIRYHQTEKERVFYAIQARLPQGKTTTGLLFLEPREDGARDIQIFVGDKYRNQGIATAAVDQIAQTVKREYADTHTLNYVPEATNYGSRSVAKKNGFARQEISVDDVPLQWQLARNRQNPTEVNVAYAKTDLESDNKAKAKALAYLTALKTFTRAES